MGRRIALAAPGFVASAAVACASVLGLDEVRYDANDADAADAADAARTGCAALDVDALPYLCMDFDYDASPEAAPFLGYGRSAPGVLQQLLQAETEADGVVGLDETLGVSPPASLALSLPTEGSRALVVPLGPVVLRRYELDMMIRIEQAPEQSGFAPLLAVATEVGDRRSFVMIGVSSPDLAGVMRVGFARPGPAPTLGQMRGVVLSKGVWYRLRVRYRAETDAGAGLLAAAFGDAGDEVEVQGMPVGPGAFALGTFFPVESAPWSLRYDNVQVDGDFDETVIEADAGADGGDGGRAGDGGRRD